MKLEAGRFLGRTSSSYSANGVRVSVQAYSAHAKLPDHAHELPHFCMVLAGSYNERIGSRSFERKPTALVYYPPEVSHAEEHFRNGRHFLVEIDLAGLESVKSRGSGLNRPMLVKSGSSFEIAMRMYCEFRTRDELWPRAREPFHRLLMSAFPQPAFVTGRTPPRWLERAKEYLNEYYSDPRALAELAAAVAESLCCVLRVELIALEIGAFGVASGFETLRP